jgi:hypothetical protein
MSSFRLSMYLYLSNYVVCNALIMTCFPICNLLCMCFIFTIFYESIQNLMYPEIFRLTSNFLGIKFCYGGMWKISYLFMSLFVLQTFSFYSNCH